MLTRCHAADHPADIDLSNVSRCRAFVVLAACNVFARSLEFYARIDLANLFNLSLPDIDLPTAGRRCVTQRAAHGRFVACDQLTYVPYIPYRISSMVLSWSDGHAGHRVDSMSSAGTMCHPTSVWSMALSRLHLMVTAALGKSGLRMYGASGLAVERLLELWALRFRDLVASTLSRCLQPAPIVFFNFMFDLSSRDEMLPSGPQTLAYGPRFNLSLPGVALMLMWMSTFDECVAFGYEFNQSVRGVLVQCGLWSGPSCSASTLCVH